MRCSRQPAENKMIGTDTSVVRVVGIVISQTSASRYEERLWSVPMWRNLSGALGWRRPRSGGGYRQGERPEQMRGSDQDTVKGQIGRAHV